jgi:hypothetical protein
VRNLGWAAPPIQGDVEELRAYGMPVVGSRLQQRAASAVLRC